MVLRVVGAPTSFNSSSRQSELPSGLAFDVSVLFDLEGIPGADAFEELTRFTTVYPSSELVVIRNTLNSLRQFYDGCACV